MNHAISRREKDPRRPVPSSFREVFAPVLQEKHFVRRDYTAVGRKTFLVEQLPDGALPIYDKDPDVTAYVVSEEGENRRLPPPKRKLEIEL